MAVNDESDLVLLAQKLMTFDPAILYSYKSAKALHIPFQYRPILKLLANDKQRILIADDVGVGKTIEAGIIHRELTARESIRNTLIICPKPLVAQSKWKTEMSKRFGENFTHMSRTQLELALRHAHIEGEWPAKFAKSIIPFSIIDHSIVQGNGKSGRIRITDIVPGNLIDLVIIDEAHHIRNPETAKHQFIKSLSSLSRYVVMMSATPVQNRIEDLYSLLQILDGKAFTNIHDLLKRNRPNAYINRAAQIARAALDGWESEVDQLLTDAISQHESPTEMRASFAYREIEALLLQNPLENNQRVQVIRAIESLNTFDDLITRTRRRDIRAYFPKRKVKTLLYEMTFLEKDIYETFIEAIESQIELRHGKGAVSFLGANLKRQISSCIPALQYIAEHRSNIESITAQLRQEEFSEDDEVEKSRTASDNTLLLNVLTQTEHQLAMLGNHDSKFASLKNIVLEKNLAENRKMLIFTSFRFTQLYIYDQIKKLNITVGMINGDTPDDERIDIANRFAIKGDNPSAIDILICTEVGSEGLDYQFCDTLVNYDLPWNPMRVEQRIGRVDRFGQKSESVSIINLICENTYDYFIYDKCLSKIGVFEKSIGYSEEKLGEFSKVLGDALMSMRLNDADKQELAQITIDQQIHDFLESQKLEDGVASLPDSTDVSLRDAYEAKMQNQIANSTEIVAAFLTKFSNGVKYSFKTNGAYEIRINNLLRANISQNLAYLPNHFRTDLQFLNLRWQNQESLQFTWDVEESMRMPEILLLHQFHPLVGLSALYFSAQAKGDG